jgi:hypothetical protein
MGYPHDAESREHSGGIFPVSSWISKTIRMRKPWMAANIVISGRTADLAYSPFEILPMTLTA